jgi:hypothetical protein
MVISGWAHLCTSCAPPSNKPTLQGHAAIAVLLVLDALARHDHVWHLNSMYFACPRQALRCVSARLQTAARNLC